MTKRILAVLILLVSLFVCCGALADSGEEANCKLPTTTIGDITVSDSVLRLKNINDTLTTTVSAVVTDEEHSWNELTVFVKLTCYDENGAEIGNSVGGISSVTYDEHSKTFKANLEFTKNNQSGFYVATVVASNTGRVFDQVSKECPVIIKFSNEVGDDETGVPYITNFTAKATQGDDDETLNLTFTVGAYLLKYNSGTEVNERLENGKLFHRLLFAVKSQDGVSSYETTIYENEFTNGSFTCTVPVSKRIGEGNYTVTVEAYPNTENWSVHANKSAEFTISKAIAGIRPKITDFTFNQNEQVLTNGTRVDLAAKATYTPSHVDVKFCRVDDDDDYVSFTLSPETSTGSDYSCSVELSTDEIHEGEYRLVGVNATIDGVSYTYYTDTDIGFTFCDEVVYTKDILLNNATSKKGQYYTNANTYDYSYEVILSTDVNPTIALKYTAVPSEKGKEISFPGVYWAVAQGADQTVCTVDENGVITAYAKGQTLIQVNSKDGKCTKYLHVIVGDQGTTEIGLNKTKLELKLGIYTSEKLTYGIQPTTVSKPGVTWSSDNPCVATVDENGLVTAVSAGTAIITAQAVSGLYATCEVTVEDVQIDWIRMDQSRVDLDLNGEAYAQLTYTQEPAIVSNPVVEWSTRDPNVATVDKNGIITAVGKGFTLVDLKVSTSADSASANIYVYVNEITTETLTLSNNEIKMVYDPSATTPATFALTCTASPVGIYNPGVIWQSTNDNVISVDDHGIVTANGEGTAYVVVLAADDPTVFTRCKVTVVGSGVTAISFDRKSITIRLNGKKKVTRKLFPNVTPESVSCKLRWTTSNSRVATVKNGIVTAKNVGVCRITCTVQGTQLKATIKVRVRK